MSDISFAGQGVDDISLATEGHVPESSFMEDRMAQIVEITDSGFIRARVTGVTDKRGQPAHVEPGSNGWESDDESKLAKFPHPEFPNDPDAVEYRAAGPITPDDANGPTFVGFRWKADANVLPGEDQKVPISSEYLCHIVPGQATGVAVELVTGEQDLPA